MGDVPYYLVMIFICNLDFYNLSRLVYILPFVCNEYLAFQEGTNFQSGVMPQLSYIHSRSENAYFIG